MILIPTLFLLLSFFFFFYFIFCKICLFSKHFQFLVNINLLFFKQFRFAFNLVCFLSCLLLCAKLFLSILYISLFPYSISTPLYQLFSVVSLTWESWWYSHYFGHLVSCFIKIEFLIPNVQLSLPKFYLHISTFQINVLYATFSSLRFSFQVCVFFSSFVF